MQHPPAMLRHALAAVVLIALAVGIVVRMGDAEEPAAGGQTTTQPLAELPGGGRSILPEHRVVVHYGSPIDRNLGILGIGTPDEAATRLLGTAEDYSGPARKPVMPAMEHKEK